MKPLPGSLEDPESLKPAILDTLVFNLLIATCRRRDRFGVRQWWYRIYAAFVKRRRTVSVTIHGRKVWVAFGNPYPFTTRLYPAYNGPLLELVHEAYRTKQRPVRLVDVGAAIGDTALLVESNCPGMISEYVCVDGEPEFFEYLKHNLSFLPNVRTILAQLSRSAGYNSSLVRIHPGAASATGSTKVKTAPLDDVLSSHVIGPIDVLKIDVDGFDGEVLCGAASTLEKDRPCVVFEWHPIWCRKTDNDWHEAFKSLKAAGYSRFVWFDKFGNFSHFMFQNDCTAMDALAEYCLADIAADWHYDVIAVHDSIALDLQSLSMLKFSRTRISHW